MCVAHKNLTALENWKIKTDAYESSTVVRRFTQESYILNSNLETISY